MSLPVSFWLKKIRNKEVHIWRDETQTHLSIKKFVAYFIFKMVIYNLA